jgi:hypothetical protein
MADTHRFAAPLWRWRSDEHGTWHFFTVPSPVAEELDATALMRRLESGRRAGFGSVKLAVRIGASEWSTSAFPIGGKGWSIPVSARIRKAEGLVEGDLLEITLTV